MRSSRVFRFIIIAALLFSFAPVGAANPFAELPPGHWSYEAIEYLGAKGLLSGERTWSFLDGRTVTRYEMAVLVSQAIRKAAEMEQGDELVLDGRVIGRAELDRIERLRKEFASELAVLGYGEPKATVEEDEYAIEGLQLGPVGQLVDARERPGVEGEHGIHRFILSTQAGEGIRVYTGWSNQVPSWDDGPQLSGVVIDVGQTLLAQVGQQEASLTELTLYGEELDGVTAGLELGQLGSTVVVGRRLADGDDGYVAAVDGRVKLGRSLIVGATHVRRADDIERMLEPVGDDLKAVTSWGGTLILHPAFSVSGEYAQNMAAEDDAGAVKVGANVRLGEVELGAKYKNLQRSFVEVDEDAGETTGYGLSLRLGDVSVTTERDVVHRRDAGEILKTITSLGVNYELGNVGVLRAGYEYVDLDTLVAQGKKGSTTSVGMDFYIPGGTITADVVYSGEGALRSPWANLGEEQGGERSTSIGLGYKMDNDISVLLGYKLVDFSGMEAEERQATATAEFSIRF